MSENEKFKVGDRVIVKRIIETNSSPDASLWGDYIGKKGKVTDTTGVFPDIPVEVLFDDVLDTKEKIDRVSFRIDELEHEPKQQPRIDYKTAFESFFLLLKNKVKDESRNYNYEPDQIPYQEGRWSELDEIYEILTETAEKYGIDLETISENQNNVD